MFDSTQLIELKLTNCRDWSVLLFRYYTICYITNYRRCRELYHDKNKLSFSINIAVTLSVYNLKNTFNWQTFQN